MMVVDPAMLVLQWLAVCLAWVDAREKTIENLKEIAEQLDKMTFDTNVSKVVGSSVAVAGGILTVVGGVLTALTLGAGSPVLIAGIATGVAGSFTAGGAFIAECVINNKKSKEMAKTCEEDKQISEELTKLSKQLTDAAENFAQRHPGMDQKKAIGKMILTALKMTGNVAFAAVKITDEIVGILGGVILRVGPRLFRGLGMAVGALFIVFDAAQIVISGKSLYKGSKSKISAEIRKQVEDLEAELKEKRNILKNLNLLQQDAVPDVEG